MSVKVVIIMGVKYNVYAVTERMQIMLMHIHYQTLYVCMYVCITILKIL